MMQTSDARTRDAKTRDVRTRDAKTRMAAESREAPRALRQQAISLTRPIADLVARLRRKPPHVVLTCARGTSAHAATFGKHLIERHLGLPVSPVAPNIASLYRQPLSIRDQLFIAVSQGGASADIIDSTTMAKNSGAITVAIVNDGASPLATAAEIVLPIAAGAELSVAATKTFVASLAVLLRLVAAWKDDAAMLCGLDRLPDRLASASGLDWSPAVPALSAAHSLIAIGRGPTLAIAREAALKLKETCGVHAEAFSGAEFQHGPLSLIEQAYPVLMFMPGDASAEGLPELSADLATKGAQVYATGPLAGATMLPVLEPDHPDVDPICLIQSFYQCAVQVANWRGRDVDRPRHLQKVTRTR
jgi:glutamine---fructose-6-phosphate transaminase (isomerizing)